MDKMVAVKNVVVKDLGGLYIDLLQSHYVVKNVATYHEDTLVYLHGTEMKDPSDLVKEWAKKPAVKMTRSEFERRKKAVNSLPKHLTSESVASMTILSGSPESSEPAAPVGATVEANLPEGPEASEAQTKPNLVKRLFRKIFS